MAETRRMVGELTSRLAAASSFRRAPCRAWRGPVMLALADVEIPGQGRALRWPQLDADFTVPGLLMGVFGSRAWMASELARRAGHEVAGQGRRRSRQRPQGRASPTQGGVRLQALPACRWRRDG